MWLYTEYDVQIFNHPSIFLVITLETTYGNLVIFTLKIKIKILAIENLWRNHLFFEYLILNFAFFGKVWSNKGKGWVLTTSHFHLPGELIATFPGTHLVPTSYPCCLKDERVHPLSQLDIPARTIFCQSTFMSIMEIGSQSFFFFFKF
jgi:hypothetical protein